MQYVYRINVIELKKIKIYRRMRMRGRSCLKTVELIHNHFELVIKIGKENAEKELKYGHFFCISDD